MSTTRNNTKVCGDNISLLTDTVYSLEVAQEFYFQKLEKVIEKVNHARRTTPFFKFTFTTNFFSRKINATNIYSSEQ